MPKLRNLIAPTSGRGYELYDLVLVYWALVFGSYLYAQPSPSSQAALAWLLGSTSLLLWGIVLNVAALTALACTFVPAAVRAGRAILFVASGVWSAVLLLGWASDATPSVDCRLWLIAAGGTAYALVSFAYIAGGRFPARTPGGPLRWVRLTSWPLRTVLFRALVFAVIVFGTIMFAGGIGDPRQFGAAVVFGFFARHAYHQTVVVHGTAREARHT